jgi:hypothetical protein
MRDLTDVTDTTTALHGGNTALHGGDTAQCVEALLQHQRKPLFLEFLSGRCLEFFVRVKIVPTVQATSQVAMKREQVFRSLR